MAKGVKLKIPPVSAYKCASCGQPLPVDERGVPVTSLYKMGRWLCPDCKYKPEAEEAKS